MASVQNRAFFLLVYAMTMQSSVRAQQPSVDFVLHAAAQTSAQIRVNSANYNLIRTLDISGTVFNLDNLTTMGVRNFTGPVQPIYTVTGLSEARWYALRLKYTTTTTDNTVRSQQKDLVFQTLSSTGNNTSEYLVNITEAVLVDQVLFVSVIPQGNEKLALIVLPELTCTNGVVKPPAQRINGSSGTPVRFELDFAPITTNVSTCTQLCIHAFVRAQMQNEPNGEVYNFQAEPWCGTVDEARAMAGSGATSLFISSILYLVISVALQISQSALT